MLKINYFPTKEEATSKSGEALNKILADGSDRATLLMLSGGSSFKILDSISEENMSESLTVSMLDERFSQDQKINNFNQLQETEFYKTALSKDVNFFGTSPRNIDTSKSLQERWENNLHRWADTNREGKIIATFGMGPDGHIAGIFPYPEDKEKFKKLFLGESWTVSYTTDKHQYAERLTTTPAFFQRIDSAIIFITGQEKKPAFDKLVSKSASIEELPAMLLHDLKNAEVFTDIKI